MEQTLLENGTVFWITKRDNWYFEAGQVSQSVVTFIALWGRYYKAGLLLLQRGSVITKQEIITKYGSTEGKSEKLGRAIYFGNQLLDSHLIWPVRDNLLLGIPETLNFC